MHQNRQESMQRKDKEKQWKRVARRKDELKEEDKKKEVR